jgi:hypothetical protein
MIYKEEVRDLFSVPEDYYLVHCISADFGMGKGIAVEFNKHFDMKNKLQTKYPDYVNQWHRSKTIGHCIYEGRVFNLVTKERYWHKPTYISITFALKQMRTLCYLNDIKKIAMPIIGCGLDRLEWSKVSKIIQTLFEDRDIEILVCRQ